MTKALSVDLRIRVLAADAGGASHREAAARFGVSAASVGRWRSLAPRRGDARPGALGDDRRTGRVAAPAGTIPGLVEAAPDNPIEERRAALAGRASASARGRSSASRSATARRAKDRPRARAGRPDILRRRRAWFEAEPGLDAKRSILIDIEAGSELGSVERFPRCGWAKTSMARIQGRAPRGRCPRMEALHRHWKTATVVGALTLRGMIAPFILSGPIDRASRPRARHRTDRPNLSPAGMRNRFRCPGI